MTVYLVKSHSVATDLNENFAGQDVTTLSGKEGHLIEVTGSHAKAVWMEIKFNEYYARWYGYKRACDARRSHDYRYPDNSKYWQTTVEIVSVDLDEKGGDN